MEGHQGYGWSIERHGADAQGAWKGAHGAWRGCRVVQLSAEAHEGLKRGHTEDIEGA